jgi:hypothetical protein
MSQLCDDIMSEKTNYLKVKKFIDLGLNPRYGMDSELTMLMYDLYRSSSGDTSYSGRWGCGACQDFVFRKLQDFINYGDNVGQKLIDWK